MIEINVSLYHSRDLLPIVEDLSLTLNEGDKIALIGEEGNGKSTLLKYLYDKELTKEYAVGKGKADLGRERAAYLPQEPEFPAVSAMEFLSPALYSADPGELAEYARRLGVETGFFWSDQCVRSLSGGEKIKLLFAKMLLQKPAVWLLDEPPNNLDLQALAWLEEMICALKEPVLFISHDERLLERTANGVLHFERLRRRTQPRYTFFRGGYRAYRETLLRAREKQAQVAAYERAEAEKREEKLRVIRDQVQRGLDTVSRADPHGARLLKKKMKSVLSQEKRYRREREDMTQPPEWEECILMRFPVFSVPAGKTALEISLPRLIAGDRLLAEDVRLTVNGRERVCIVGRNGCGKSSLLRIAAQAGEERRAFYMPQDYDEALRPGMTALTYLETQGGGAEREHIAACLGCMRFTREEMERDVAALSGGQRAKLLLTKANLTGAQVLILDEPSRNFSPLSAGAVADELACFSGAILFVSHDRAFIERVATAVFELTEKGLVPREKENLFF